MEVLEGLKKSREFLNEHTWGKGRYYNSYTNAYCAIGAVRQAITHSTNYIDTPEYIDEWLLVDKIHSKLDECLPEGYTNVIVYNDDVHTTKGNILTVFDCAIEKLENAGQSQS